MPRYVIADPDTRCAWPLFVTDPRAGGGRHAEREREVRFVYDLDDKRFIHVDVDGSSPSDAELADLLEDLKCNHAFHDPDACGLLTDDELPKWCSPPSLANM